MVGGSGDPFFFFYMCRRFRPEKPAFPFFMCVAGCGDSTTILWFPPVSHISGRQRDPSCYKCNNRNILLQYNFPDLMWLDPPKPKYWKRFWMPTLARICRVFSGYLSGIVGSETPLLAILIIFRFGISAIIAITVISYSPYALGNFGTLADQQKCYINAT